jgi:hypothetical protein
MATQLRPIALTVSEPRPGLFHWALLERSGEAPAFDRRVAFADEPYDSFEKAARAGLLNWLRLAGDEPRRGPRTQPVRQPLVPAPGPWSVRLAAGSEETDQTSPATSSS